MRASSASRSTDSDRRQYARAAHTAGDPPGHRVARCTATAGGMSSSLPAGAEARRGLA